MEARFAKEECRQSPKSIDATLSRSEKNNLAPLILPQSQALEQLLVIVLLLLSVTRLSLPMISFQCLVHGQATFAVGTFRDEAHEELRARRVCG